MNLRITLLLLCCSLAASHLRAEKRAIVPKEFAAGPGATGLPYSPAFWWTEPCTCGPSRARSQGRPDPSEFESEVKNALDNAGLVLKAAGFGFEDAVAVQVYLTDMDLFRE